MLAKAIIAGLLFALLIALPNKQTPAPQLNNSETVVTTQPAESAKQPPSNASEHLAKPVEPEIKAVESESRNAANPQNVQPSQSKPVVQTPPVPVDDHEQLLAAAGVPSKDWEEAKYIFDKESTWRPTARNKIGCIGLGQNCPDVNGHYWLTDACPNWQSDPVCQIKRFSHYATERYGSWQAAYAFWLKMGWW